MNELDAMDIETLIEALEAWESKDTASEMFSDVMDLIVGPGQNQEQVATLKAQRFHRQQEAVKAKLLRKERSILLRAKLIMYREERLSLQQYRTEHP